MKQVMEGSHAASEAVRLAKVQVISAYPITPQTHIVEALSEYCENGTMDARFLCVESEHSALAAVISASTMGVRTFTATSSHGLALMHELLHWASGARLPIVMAEVNRALGPGWNIWADQTDSLAQRDTGWIQFYCEDGQEVFDTTLHAFRLAEWVNLPVMVIQDAFFLSHTLEPVDIPDQKQVDQFLPPFSSGVKLDTEKPCNMGQLTPPSIYMEMRQNIQMAMEQVSSCYLEVEKEFSTLFDRQYGPVEAVACEDAEVILVVSGTIASTCRSVISDLRSKGENVGMLKIKMFRPFPADFVRRAVRAAKKVAVIDRNISFGAGGIFCQEVKSALYNMDPHPPVFGYIAGLGGRDVTPDSLEAIYWKTKKGDLSKGESTWVETQEVELKN